MEGLKELDPVAYVRSASTIEISEKKGFCNLWTN